MGTKNDPGQYDCHAKAAPDEPLFTLLGRDKHAPTLVRLWALLRQADGEDEEKIAEALACANAMDEYRAEDTGIAAGSPWMTKIERIFAAATEGMDEHPEGFDWSCDCNLCRSYA